MRQGRDRGRDKRDHGARGQGQARGAQARQGAGRGQSRGNSRLPSRQAQAGRSGRGQSRNPPGAIRGRGRRGAQAGGAQAGGNQSRNLDRLRPGGRPGRGAISTVSTGSGGRLRPGRSGSGAGRGAGAISTVSTGAGATMRQARGARGQGQAGQGQAGQGARRFPGIARICGGRGRRGRCECRLRAYAGRLGPFEVRGSTGGSAEPHLSILFGKIFGRANARSL